MPKPALREARCAKIPRLDRLARMQPGTPSLVRRFARLTFLNVLANITVPLASLVDMVSFWG